MDRQIKQLLYVISQKYRATINMTLYFSEQTGRVGTAIRLSIYDKESEDRICTKDFHGKRDLIIELVKWAS